MADSVASMASVIKSVSSDAADPRALARFRAAALGAAVLRRFPHSVIMAAPEGNEFCVEPGPA